MLAAFKKYLGLRSDEDLEELEKQWYEYVDNELVISSSKGLASAAFDNLRRGRKLKAKRLFGEAIAAGGARALDHFRYGELLALLDEDKEARKQWQKAIELDPLTTDYYIAYGRSLLRKRGGEREEGERMIRLALEIEPDNLYLEKNAKRLLDN